MKTRKILALVLSLIMLLGVCGTALAAPHATDEVTELETYNSNLSEALAEEGYALLENNGILPLDKGETKIALYGNAIAYTVKGGTGSGAVNNRLNAYGVNGDNIADAFVDAGWTVTNPEYVDAVRLNNGNRRTSVVAAQAITDAQIEEGLAADTAIYAIARNAGEGSDRQANNATNGYNLTAIELANIQKVCDAYENVIIVYNTCVMDAGWQEDYENIDAVVYMNNGGQRGSEALVNLLTGKATFSGKLTDTWPKSYEDYPSTPGFANNDGNTMTEYYTEGIYVGYRYFDTFGYDVCYPFGYGLSYTEFDIVVKDVAVEGDEVIVTARVANVGSKYSGKEVVEVYFSAPDGELEKPYQELAAYGKTDLLAPGEAQTLTLRYDIADMSSYSMDRAAYIMEAGDYIIRVGNSSRNTVAAAKIVLDETAVVEQLSNQKVKEENAVLDEISKAGATPIANNDAEELANAPVIEIAAADLPYEDNTSPYDDETITTYLLAEDAENYQARESITLRTNTVNGIINNAQILTVLSSEATPQLHTLR
jgi:beta-glucosidase